MELKIQKKNKIIVMLLLVTIMSMIFNPTFAMITQYEGGIEPITMEDTDGTGAVVSVLERALEVAEGSVATQLIVKMITAIARWIVTKFMEICGMLFARLGVTANTTIYFPMMDDIIFNTLPFFDPNFINPTQDAKASATNFIEYVSNVISPIYYSAVAVGTLFLAVAALAIGIKLVISISPEEKAQYKKSVSTWVVGIVLLYTGHIAMSGIMYMNEQVVTGFYNATNSKRVKFKVPIAETVSTNATSYYDGYENQNGYYYEFDEVKRERDKRDEQRKAAKAMNIKAEESENKFIVPEDYGPIESVEYGGYGGNVHTKTYAIVSGFQGLFEQFYYQSSEGSITATVIIGVIAGQTLILAIYYAKRMFFSFILGILYPFVVIFDTIQRVLGKGSGIINKWFAQFSVNIFMQSIHAMALYFMYKVIVMMTIRSAGLNLSDVPTGSAIVINPFDGNKKNEFSGIAHLISLTELILIVSFTKLEGVVKSLLGLDAAGSGTLKESTQSAMAGYAMAKNAKSRIKDNFTGVRDGAKKVRDLKKEYNEAKDNETRSKPAVEPTPLEELERNSSENASAQVTNQVRAATINAIEANGAGGANVGTGVAAGSDYEAFIRSQEAVKALGKNIALTSNGLIMLNMKLSNLENAMKEDAKEPEELGSKVQIKKGRSSAEIKKELGSAQRNLLGKTVAAAASPSIVLSGAALGIGAGDEKLGAAVISAADAVAESVGRKLAQTSVGRGITDVEANISEKIEYHNSTTIIERHEDRINNRNSSRVSNDTHDA